MSNSSKKNTVNIKPVDSYGVVFLFILIGCFFFFNNKFMSTSFEDFKKNCSFSTTATVTNLNERGSKAAPVFEFKFQNRNYKYTGDVYKKKGTYEIGDTVKIYIDPITSSRIFIPGYTKGETSNKIIRIITKVFGVLMWIAGVLTFFTVSEVKKNGGKQTNHLDDVSCDTIDEISTYEENDEYQ